MGGKSSAPAAPDPYAVSSAQTGSNVATALANSDLNKYTTNTPLGNSTWSTNGYQTVTDPTTGKSFQIPNYVNNVTLNPTAQQALSTTQQNQLGQAQTEQGFLHNVAQQLQNPLTQGQFSPIQTNVNNTSLYNPQGTGAEQQAFGSEYSLVQPLMQQQTQQTQDQLRAEGIPEGSDLWNTEMQNVGRQQSNQIAGLAGNAVGLGIGEQGQQFNQNVGTAQMANAGEQQQMQQALALQNQPLNELNALQTGSQVQTPQFQATPAVSMSPTNVSGNVYSSYQGQVNSANANNALWNNTMNSILGSAGNLGGAYMMSNAITAASDERVKEDIRPTGIELHEFRYAWDPEGTKRVGVIAQDVEKKYPDSVHISMDGVRRVNFAKLLMQPRP